MNERTTPRTSLTEDDAESFKSICSYESALFAVNLLRDYIYSNENMIPMTHKFTSQSSLPSRLVRPAKSSRRAVAESSLSLSTAIAEERNSRANNKISTKSNRVQLSTPVHHKPTRSNSKHKSHIYSISFPDNNCGDHNDNNDDDDDDESIDNDFGVDHTGVNFIESETHYHPDEEIERKIYGRKEKKHQKIWYRFQLCGMVMFILTALISGSIILYMKFFKLI